MKLQDFLFGEKEGDGKVKKFHNNQFNFNKRDNISMAATIKRKYRFEGDINLDSGDNCSKHGLRESI